MKTLIIITTSLLLTLTSCGAYNKCGFTSLENKTTKIKTV